jgi:hypothetical protein
MFQRALPLWRRPFVADSLFNGDDGPFGPFLVGSVKWPAGAMQGPRLHVYSASYRPALPAASWEDKDENTIFGYRSSRPFV